MLDFRIATFLSVCDTLNYTRSAEELSITQPAVSQHIAQLEKRLGAKLFERHGKALSLTGAGRKVRDVAETMVHDEHLLKEAIASAPNEEAPLSVGVTLTAGEYLVAQPIARYLACRPTARVRIVQGDTGELVAMLHSGELDCAFVEGSFDTHAFASKTLCRQALAAVCAPESPLGAGNARTFKSLLECRLIVRERGSGTRAVLERALFDRNLSVASFSRLIEATSINIIKTLVAEGAGIAFLYEAAVERDIASGRLARIPLAEPTVEHDIAFIHLAESAFSDRLARFFDDIAGHIDPDSISFSAGLSAKGL